MIVTLFQDFKFLGKQISLTFFYFLINNALLYYFLANLNKFSGFVVLLYVQGVSKKIGRILKQKKVKV